MFRKIIIPILIVVLSFHLAFTLPIPPEVISDLPDSIKAINNPTDLKRIFDRPGIFVKAQAAIRLGQIGGQTALNILKDAVAKEPLPNIRDYEMPRVKYYLLDNIGIIGGKEAENYLLTTAKKYTKAIISYGWRENSIGKTAWSADTSATLLGLFSGLSHLHSDSATMFLCSICDLEKGNLFMRRIGCKYYVHSYLTQPGFKTFNDSLSYLVKAASLHFGETDLIGQGRLAKFGSSKEK